VTVFFKARYAVNALKAEQRAALFYCVVKSKFSAAAPGDNAYILTRF